MHALGAAIKKAINLAVFLKEWNDRVKWDVIVSTVKLTDYEDKIDEWDSETIEKTRLNSAVHISIRID